MNCVQLVLSRLRTFFKEAKELVLHLLQALDGFLARSHVDAVMNLQVFVKFFEIFRHLHCRFLLLLVGIVALVRVETGIRLFILLLRADPVNESIFGGLLAEYVQADSHLGWARLQTMRVLLHQLLVLAGFGHADGLDALVHLLARCPVPILP